MLSESLTRSDFENVKFGGRELKIVVYVTTYSQVASRKPFIILFSLGLKVGDKILQANGNDFTMVTLRQAERRIGKKDILRVKITRAELQNSVAKNWNVSGNI